VSAPPHGPIHGPRLVLRRLGDADVTPEYVGWLNDPDVSRFMETRWSTHTLEGVRQFVERVNARSDEFLFGMFLISVGRHIGNIKVGPIRPIHLSADVSLFVGAKDQWGRGLASEAISLVSAHAFSALGVRKLNAGVYAPNAASVAAFLKAGWLPEGTRKNQFLLEGAPCDEVVLGAMVDGSLSGEGA
jgi:[ribosomal protein S5]-alanine N-acetyltransferase